MAGDDRLLIEIIDHELDTWRRIGVEQALRQVRPMLHRLARDGRITEILAQLVGEAEDEKAALAAELRGLARRARGLWDAEKDLLLPLDSDGSNDLREVAKFGDHVSELEGVQKIDAESVKLIEFRDLLSHLAEWFALLRGRALPLPARIVAGGRAANQLQLEFEGLKRRIALSDNECPGACVARLRKIEDALAASPPPTDADLGDAFQYVIDEGVHKVLRSAYDDPESFNDAEGPPARERVSQALSDGTIVLEELRLRLALGWSRRAMVQRFAARCTRFDSDRLRRVCSAEHEGTGGVEDRLTNELARYLFDLGLSPIFSADVGNVRPDILDPSAGSSCLYVEAKQYGDQAPGPAEVRKWAAQVWNTWDLLDQNYPGRVPEAFLVIFRWGLGAPISLPRLVVNRGRVLYPLLVDIAPSSARGSRAIRQREVAEEELLPVEVRTSGTSSEGGP